MAKVLVQPVGSHGQARIDPGRAAKATLVPGLNRVAAHDPGHPMSATGDPLASQVGMDARTAVGLAALDVHQADAGQQHLVGQGSLAGRAFAPSIVAAGQDVQHVAHSPDRKLAPMHGDELVDG